MKIKDLTDIRKKSITELDKLILKKKGELEETKVEMSMGQENNLKKAKNLKKDIAQIMTIKREKQIVKEYEETEKKTKKNTKSKKKGKNK